VALVTLDEFKTTVQDFVERQDGQALPRPGELMLLGHGENSGWKRARIKPPYSNLVAGSMVRGFILKFKVDRLAIVIPGDAARHFRVGFTERDGTSDSSDITDRRLVTLIAAAHKQWSHKPRRLWRLWGRPWPIPLLSAALLLELGPGMIRLLRGIALSSPPVYFAEVVLVVATVVTLWRRPRIGYGLALLLSALQVIYPLTVDVPLVSSLGLAAVVPWLLLAWSFPALIWLLLGIVYFDAPSAAVT
jgi:hypothetical protein